MAAKLYYFPAGGRAELSRTIAAAGGVELIEAGMPGEGFDKLEFGSPSGVPLLEHGNLKMSQSTAIENYLSLLAFPDLPPQMRAVDSQFCSIKEDVAAGTYKVLFSPMMKADRAKAAEELGKNASKWYPAIDKLCPAYGFINGEAYPTAADVAVLNMCDAVMSFGIANKIAGVDWATYPKMRALANRTAEYPRLKEYLAKSTTFTADPMGLLGAAKVPVSLKKAVFLNAHHSGHFNPTVELVKIMVDAGIEVHYFATANLRSKIESVGAIFHNYGSDDWSLTDCALEGTVAIGCTPSEEMKAEFLMHQLMVASVHLLPYLLEELRKINPGVIVADSSYPWGPLSARILGIPSVSSCSAVVMPEGEMEAVFGNLRELDFNVKAKAVLAEKYSIDYDPRDSYCNYSNFTICWCHPKFLGVDVGTQDPRCRFFGASLAMPPSDKEAVVQAAIAQIKPEPDGYVFPLAELKKKVDAGERVIYISMGTVMGSEPWTFGILGSFYQNVFNAFSGDSGVTVVVAVGKVKIQDLPPVPANYIVRNSVPQKELLLIASLFVTHNGMNSTNEAMFAGVPMVCMPGFADQHFNAARVEALELGVHLKSPFAPAPPENVDHLSSTAIKAAAEQIFADYARFKTKCDEMRRNMFGLVEYLHTQALSDISEWAKEEAPRRRKSLDAKKQGELIKAQF